MELTVSTVSGDSATNVSISGRDSATRSPPLSAVSV